MNMDGINILSKEPVCLLLCLSYPNLLHVQIKFFLLNNTLNNLRMSDKVPVNLYSLFQKPLMFI